MSEVKYFKSLINPDPSYHISDINAKSSRQPDMSNSDMEAVQSSELLRLQEKVKALERQNLLLKQSKTGDQMTGGSSGKRSSILSSGDEDDIKLLEIEDTDGSEESWVFELRDVEERVRGEDCDWLRADVISPETQGSAKKKSLVNKLDDIAKSKYSVSQSVGRIVLRFY